MTVPVPNMIDHCEHRFVIVGRTHPRKLSWCYRLCDLDQLRCDDGNRRVEIQFVFEPVQACANAVNISHKFDFGGVREPTFEPYEMAFNH